MKIEYCPRRDCSKRLIETRRPWGERVFVCPDDHGYSDAFGWHDNPKPIVRGTGEYCPKCHHHSIHTWKRCDICGHNYREQ
jgi:hypothetical protein